MTPSARAIIEAGDRLYANWKRADSPTLSLSAALILEANRRRLNPWRGKRRKAVEGCGCFRCTASREFSNEEREASKSVVNERSLGFLLQRRDVMLLLVEGHA